MAKRAPSPVGMSCRLEGEQGPKVRKFEYRVWPCGTKGTLRVWRKVQDRKFNCHHSSASNIKILAIFGIGLYLVNLVTLLLDRWLQSGAILKNMIDHDESLVQWHWGLLS